MVALAFKLAVILQRMLRDETNFIPRNAVAATAP